MQTSEAYLCEIRADQNSLSEVQNDLRHDKTKFFSQLNELQTSNEHLKTKFSDLLEKFEEYIARVQEDQEKER